MSSNSRIAKNTLLLYFRQILVMLVSLYTMRVVLKVLGVEDYGIYDVVAGVITSFSFLNGAMAIASQRYFSFDLGKKDHLHLKNTFNVTFQIYIIIVIAIVIIAETIGLWFITHKLVLPENRITASVCVYQAAVLSFILSLMTAPYVACVIAHENMNVYAYASIIEVTLKLVCVFIVQVMSYDKLIIYSFSLVTVMITNALIYRYYCKKHYNECQFKFTRDKKLFKELISYCGWNLFGASVGVAKYQLTNILLNIYQGVIVNAARGIANYVNVAVMSFSQSFNTALRPPIIKSYALKQQEDTLKLVFRGCKFTFFLVYIFALPLVLEMNTVLCLWLENPPDYAVMFTSLAIVDAVIDSISYPVMTLAQATGKIKLYQGVVGGVLLLNFPISWIFLRLGAPAYSVMIIAIIITFLALVVRLYIIRKLVFFPVGIFLSKTIMPCIIVAISSAILPIYYHCYNEASLLRFIVTVFISLLSTSLCVLFLGMNRQERLFVVSKIKERNPFCR